MDILFGDIVFQGDMWYIIGVFWCCFDWFVYDLVDYVVEIIKLYWFVCIVVWIDCFFRMIWECLVQCGLMDGVWIVEKIVDDQMGQMYVIIFGLSVVFVYFFVQSKVLFCGFLKKSGRIKWLLLIEELKDLFVL